MRTWVYTSPWTRFLQLLRRHRQTYVLQDVCDPVSYLQLAAAPRGYRDCFLNVGLQGANYIELPRIFQDDHPGKVGQ